MVGVNEKKYVINKSKNKKFHKTLVQTLASTKKQNCIVKYLRRSSSGEFKGLPDPHLGWGYLLFVTVNQIEFFS